MHGLIMANSLAIESILSYAEKYFSSSEIVSVNPEGGITRYTYQDAAERMRRLANVLKDFGVGQQECVGTLAWNTHRHLELYYAVSGSGAILHTINPRLFPEQITYIVNHAEDRVLFVDRQFIPLLESVINELPLVEKIVVLTDRKNMPQSALQLLCYEELLAAASATFHWPTNKEDSAASLCYTSGTTGNPKGVLYSHRSTVLHALALRAPQVIGVSQASVILPVVPMFHVNSWGVPYGALMAGAKLVLPGSALDGESLAKLITAESADILLGVPTVWSGLLDYCDKHKLILDSVKDVVIGGSAASYGMIKKFHEQHNAFVIHAWGMTELSPIGSVNSWTPQMAKMTIEERYQAQTKQGRPVFGVEMKLIGPDDNELPHDGSSFGRLLVRGLWVASGYYKNEDNSAWVDGWFDTGDVATIDCNGIMKIVDRAKDVIKSGGEWISSIDVENAVASYPGIRECAVVGIPHPKWEERPLLFVVAHDNVVIDQTELMAFLAEKIVKWWLPEAMITLDQLPHTATGKILKRALRDQYADHYK